MALALMVAGVALRRGARGAAAGAALVAGAAVKVSGAVRAPFALLGSGRPLRLVAGRRSPRPPSSGSSLAVFGAEVANALGIMGGNQNETSYYSVPSTVSRLAGIGVDPVRFAFLARRRNVIRSRFASKRNGRSTLIRKRPLKSRLTFERLEWRDLPAFVTPPVYPAGTNPTAMVAADFNGDGLQDIAVANQTTPGKVNVLLNTGGGVFGSAVSFRPVVRTPGHWWPVISTATAGLTSLWPIQTAERSRSAQVRVPGSFAGPLRSRPARTRGMSPRRTSIMMAPGSRGSQ